MKTLREPRLSSQEAVAAFVLIVASAAAFFDRGVPATFLSLIRGYDPTAPALVPSVTTAAWVNVLALGSAVALVWVGATSLRLLGASLVAVLGVFSLLLWAFPPEAARTFVMLSTLCVVYLALWENFTARARRVERFAIVAVGTTLALSHYRAFGGGVGLTALVEWSATLSAIAVFWAWAAPRTTRRWVGWAALAMVASMFLVLGASGVAGSVSFFASLGVSFALPWPVMSFAAFLLMFTALACLSRGEKARGIALLMLPVAGLLPTTTHQYVLGALALATLLSGRCPAAGPAPTRA